MSQNLPRQRRITVAEINGLRTPGRHSIAENLILCVRASGARSWLARVRDAHGKRRDIGLGSYPSVSLEEARRAVAYLQDQVRKGLDPVAEKHSGHQLVPTFREAALQAYAERHAGWRNEKHRAQWLSSVEKYAFPKLGSLKVQAIEPGVIIESLMPIWLRLPETARRVRQRILATLNWSYAHGYRTAEAPARAVSMGLPKQSRKSGRFSAMPYPELPAFVAELQREPETVGRLALLFTILTAARSGETRGATWDELNLSDGIWTIPAGRMKAGEVHSVPLSEPALRILRRLHAARSSLVVFPGHHGRPLSDATLSKVVRTKQLPYTVHGFRSSFRDWAAETEAAPGEVAEAALAHTVQKRVEAAYRRTKYLDRRKILMQDWAEFLEV